MSFWTFPENFDWICDWTFNLGLIIRLILGTIGTIGNMEKITGVLVLKLCYQFFYISAFTQLVFMFWELNERKTP